MQIKILKHFTERIPLWTICQRKLNEEIIDYDLLEDLVCYIDETYPEGAILVFLPVSPSINT